MENDIPGIESSPIETETISAGISATLGNSAEYHFTLGTRPDENSASEDITTRAGAPELQTEDKMSYRIAYESKPEDGQILRGTRFYMNATQAINAAKKMASKNFNVSAMKTSHTGELVEILWTTAKTQNN